MSYYRGIVSAFITLMFPVVVFAQNAMWTKTYGGSYTDEAYSVVSTQDNGYILAGYTTSYGAGSEDVYIIKTDDSGSTQWTRTFGGGYYDFGTKVIQTQDGGYAIAGYAWFTRQYDFYLVRLNPQGDSLWAKTYGGSAYDVARAVIQTQDGGFMLAGYTTSTGSGGKDVMLVKTNANGDSLWARVYGGTDDDEAYAVCQTSDNGYIVAGYTKSSGVGGKDVLLLKLDSNGDSVWAKTLGGMSDDGANDLRVTYDNGYVIAGYTASFGAGNFDMLLVRTDSAGNMLGMWAFGGGSDDEAQSVIQTPDSNFVLAGFTNSQGAGNYDMYILKSDAQGNALWQNTFGGTDEDKAYAVCQSPDGSFGIAGYTKSEGAGNEDVFLVKTDPRPATFHLISPQNGAYVSNQRPSFLWHPSYDPDGLRNYDIYIDNSQRDSLADTVWNCNFDITEGYHNWYVVATDNFGNSRQSEETYLLGVDITPPNIDSTTQWNNTTQMGPFEVRARVRDNFSGVDSVLLFYKRQEDADFSRRVMHQSGNYFTDSIPAVGNTDDTVLYYIYATDRSSPENSGTDPQGAPSNSYSFVAGASSVNESGRNIGHVSFSIKQLQSKVVRVGFFIPKTGKVSLKIFNVTGRFEACPVNGTYEKGEHTIYFKLNKSGLYFYRLSAPFGEKSGCFWVVK